MRIVAAITPARSAPFEVREVEIDGPGPGEVLVRIAGTGVCHTDAAARDGDLPFPTPGVLGHEGAGTVVAVGSGVSEVSEGQDVVIGWPWCGHCRACRAGEHRYCASVFALSASGGRLDGTTGLRERSGERLASHFFGQSSFATHALTYASSLVPIPPGLSPEIAGTLACGFSTGAGAVLNTVRPAPGDSIAIFGAGAVGLAAVMAGALTAATRIVAVDRSASRLATAARLGATHTVDVSVVDPTQAVLEICDGPADHSVDCTGTVAGAQSALAAIGMRGTCVLVGGTGVGTQMSVDHGSLLRGKTVTGVLGGGGRSRELIGALMDLHLQGRFPFDSLIERFELGEIDRAFAASADGTAVKPVVTMPR